MTPILEVTETWFERVWNKSRLQMFVRPRTNLPDAFWAELDLGAPRLVRFDLLCAVRGKALYQAVAQQDAGDAANLEGLPVVRLFSRAEPQASRVLRDAESATPLRFGGAAEVRARIEDLIRSTRTPDGSPHPAARVEIPYFLLARPSGAAADEYSAAVEYAKPMAARYLASSDLAMQRLRPEVGASLPPAHQLLDGPCLPASGRL